MVTLGIDLSKLTEFGQLAVEDVEEIWSIYLGMVEDGYAQWPSDYEARHLINKYRKLKF